MYISFYVNILACSKAKIIEIMLKTVNLLYVAQNQSSVMILKYKIKYKIKDVHKG